MDREKLLWIRTSVHPHFRTRDYVFTDITSLKALSDADISTFLNASGYCQGLTLARSSYDNFVMLVSFNISRMMIL